jgi:stage III sporulation protein AF
MISFLSTWIGQIAVSVIIVSIFEMILPNGNLKKYIKVVLGIYIVYCMITPFVNRNKLFDINDLDIKKYTTNNISKSKINQESMDERLEELYIDEIEKNINTKLNEFGYEIYKCKIDANLNGNKENSGIHRIDLMIKKSQNNKIKIDEVEIEKNTNQQENEDININQIKQIIADYLEISQNIISIKVK